MYSYCLVSNPRPSCRVLQSNVSDDTIIVQPKVHLKICLNEDKPLLRIQILHHVNVPLIDFFIRVLVIILWV